MTDSTHVIPLMRALPWGGAPSAGRRVARPMDPCYRLRYPCTGSTMIRPAGT